MAMTAVYTNFFGMVVHQSRNGVERDIIPDPLGSVAHLVDEDQNITASYTYTPYGEIESHTGEDTPLNFVGTLGYYRDTLVSKLTYIRARWYKAEYGRWMTVDPLWPSQRAYGYCWESPHTYVDILGLSPSASCLNAGNAWIGVSPRPGESTASKFRRCQSSLENQDQSRKRLGLSSVCPGGPHEICLTCKQLTGLKINCTPHKACYPTVVESDFDEFPWGAIGTIIDYGTGVTFDTDKCIRNCIIAAQLANERPINKKSVRHVCQAACLAFRQGGCNVLWDRCHLMGDYYQRLNCLNFYFTICKNK